MSARNGPRHRWIDGVFNRTDPLPDLILAVCSMLIVLLVALWLFGVLLPNNGRPGPLDFEQSPPVPLSWLRTGDQPEIVPDDGWSEQRDWLDDNLCAVTVSWNGLGERQAVARRLSDDGTLCSGLERSLARAPLTPLLGAAGSAAMAVLLTSLLAWFGWRASLAFFHVRRAYRRLYLSEHRTDHEEDPAGTEVESLSE